MTNEYYKKKFKKNKENEVLKEEKESRFDWGNKIKRSTNRYINILFYEYIL